MAKSSRGTPHSASSNKKKAKSRPEFRPVAVQPRSVEPEETVESPKPRAQAASGSVLQFRPKGSDRAVRSGARGGVAARTFQQIVDYSYVYTDLKIIGALVTSLLVVLVALSFVIK